MNVADRAVIKSHLLAVGLNEVGGHLFPPLSDAVDPTDFIQTEINGKINDWWRTKVR